MSVFTEAEIGYLRRQTMGRLATVGRDGQPHVIPLTFRFNPDEDTIDVGGVGFPSGKKWRDLQSNRQVTILIDDAVPGEAHAIEVRGLAEIHHTGGEGINPRFPSFAPEFIRIRPRFVVSWGLEEPGFHPYGRRVG
jgi:pyridoxamine 5'-phosphate oxidase family protein